MPVGREDHQERKDNHIDRYRNRAAKANKEADQLHDKAREMGSVIPFGQPILVGHHSEGSHRALIKRLDTAHRKVAEAYDKADYYDGKADTAESNHAISGDDPEAVQKYQVKLAKLEESQEYMKALNAAWKKGKAALVAMGLSEAKAEELANEKEKPCPTWMLSNNGAQIRIVKEKLETLKKLDGMAAENIKFDGGELVINTELNRVQIIFDDIPSPEIRARLKSRGFKWARSQGAWQRQRTLNAVVVAKRLIEEFTGGKNGNGDN